MLDAVLGMLSLNNIAYAAETGGEGISVHLAPYVVGHIGSLPITSTLLTSWLAMVVLVVGAFFIRKNLKVDRKTE